MKTLREVYRRKGSEPSLLPVRDGFGTGGVEPKNVPNLGPPSQTRPELENGQKPLENQSGSKGSILFSTYEQKGVNEDKKGGGGRGRANSMLPLLPASKPSAFLSVEGGRLVAARKTQGGRLVACGESGQRVGEDHPRATLSNAQVDEIRDRFEAHPLGDPRHEGYRLLAREFRCSKSMIRNIVHYRKRNVFTATWKRLDK